MDIELVSVGLAGGVCVFADAASYHYGLMESMEVLVREVIALYEAEAAGGSNPLRPLRI